MVQTIDMLGIGYCGMDTFCLLPRIPLDEKVPIQKMLVQSGGPAATATVTATRLGLSAAFAGAVGDDVNASLIVDAFESEQVQTQFMIKRCNAQSATAICWIDQLTGKRSIAWTHGDAAEIDPQELKLGWLDGVRAIHCDGHQLSVALHAACYAKEHGIPVFLDAGTILPGIDELIARSTVVFASETFAIDYTGKNDFEDAVMALHALGPQWAGVTRGNKGSLGFDGQQMHHVRAVEVEVVDTTGAGDAFHGAIVARYVMQPSNERSLLDCMRYASVVAALNCRELGGRTAIPDHQLTMQTMQSVKW